MATILDNDSVHDFPLCGNSLIEASAGTGKTYTIANLYVRQVVAGRGVRELLVVTFTESATEELRGRIRARLHQAARLLHSGDDSNDAFLQGLAERCQDERETAVRRLQLAVHSMDEAAIFTIHGFCQRMLTEFAFNSGQGFRFEVVGDDGELRLALLRDWWRTVFYAEIDTGLLAAIRASLSDPDTFLKRVKPLLELDEPVLVPQAAGWAALEAGWQAFEQALAAVVSEWRQRGDELKQRLRDGCAYRKDAKLVKDMEADLAQLDASLLGLGRMPADDNFKVVCQSQIIKAQLKKRDPSLDDDFFVRCDELLAQRQRFDALILPWAMAAARDYVRAGIARRRQSSARFSFNDLIGELRDALQGERAEALAAAIRGRFPVAMIDEFQDTDPTQYAIFRAVYHGQPDCAWTMIGDPKQAIYSFRGGDIFTYARARADVGEQGRYTLDTNWRSVPEVVAAVNQLFSIRDDAFVYSDAIPFEPIKAADQPHDRLSERGNTAAAGLHLWHWVDDGEKFKPIPANTAMPVINRALAAEIVRLIAGGRSGDIRIGKRPLRPADIAVLVRSHKQSEALREVLAEWGVSAVTVGNDKVFGSDEAAGLLALLRAVAAPADRRLALTALASPLLGRDYSQIQQAGSDDHAWGQWCAELVELNRVWQQQGFMAQFQQLLQRLSIPQALAGQDNSERRITNLLHLGELCQQQARRAAGANLGIDGLLHWMADQIHHPEGDEQELRLESDAELVQLVTIHKSKGLEYPVVFVPYLWSCRAPEKKEGVGFHRDGLKLLDIGSDQQQGNLCLAEKERLAEDLRLLYVAVTRARVRCYLVWGALGGKPASNYRRTALGYLLMNRQQPDDLDQSLPDAAPKGTTADAILASLAELAGQDAIAGGSLADGADDERVVPLPLLEQGRQLVERRFTGTVASDWRVESFSSLARQLSGHSAPRGAPDADPALRFARGSQVGSFIHGLFEELDFQADPQAQLNTLIPAVAAHYGFDISAAQQRDLLNWLPRVLATPLDGADLRLSGIAASQRLNELEFDLSTGTVDIAALDQLLTEVAGHALPGIGAEGFQGVVNGIIDLVFEHQGRYYLADYKSNYLGPSFSDYGGEQLEQAMIAHRYDLQYTLYTLALHRYLRTRIADYDYDRHFGGAYYLFLRGMRPETGAGQGVYFGRLQRGLVERLDEQLFAM